MSVVELNKVYAVSEFKEVLLHSKNYFSANVATKALSVISLPIFTTILTPAEYGTYQVFLSYVGIFSIILTLNFNGSIARYYYDKTDDFGSFLSTSLLGSISILGLSIIVILLSYDHVSYWFKLPKELLTFLIVCFITNLFFSTLSQVNIAQSNSLRLSKLIVFKSYSTFLLGVSMILVFEEEKYRGLIYAEITVGLIIAFYCFLFLKKIIKFSFRLSHVRYILSYSVSLMPYLLSGVILGQIDRIMINSYYSTNEVGLYSVAYNIGAMLTIVVAALNTAFTPKWFELRNSGKYEEVNKLESGIYIIVLFCASGLVLFSNELFLILISDAFQVSKHIVPIVVLAYVVESVFKVYGRVIGYTKKMLYMSVIGIIGAFLNVFLNYIFIPIYGYEAAAVTTLAAFFAMLLSAVWIAKHQLRQKIIPLQRFLKPTLLFTALIMFVYVLETVNLPYVMVVISKILLFSVLTYYFFNYMKLRLAPVREGYESL